MRDINSTLPLYQQEQILREAFADELSTTDPELYVLPNGELGNVSVDGSGWRYVVYDVPVIKSIASRFVSYSETKAKGSSTSLELKPSVPTDLARAYMGSHRWDGIPTLKRAEAAPAVGPDLTVRWDVGWDPDSHIYVTEGMQPAWDLAGADVRSAAEFLIGWLKPFAFKHAESKADCLALALSPYLMHYLGDATVPGGLFSATRQGSGKTELARLVSVLGSGRPVEPVVWSYQGEMRNKVTSHLLESPPVALIDNIKVSMDSDVLESLLTSRRLKDRAFHKQQNLDLRNDTLWLFTKNAPDMSGDMLRRLVIVPLDKDKWEGDWVPEVVAKAAEQRRAIVTAMVSLIMSWDGAGRPPGSVCISGYEVWSRTVSGILENAGVTGFYQHRDDIVATSVDTGEDDEAVMVERIARVMGSSDRWRARELWDRVNDAMHTAYLTPDGAAIRTWLDSGASTNRGMATGHKLSTLANKAIPGCDWKLIRHSDKRYSLKWMNAEVEAPPTF